MVIYHIQLMVHAIGIWQFLQRNLNFFYHALLQSLILYADIPTLYDEITCCMFSTCSTAHGAWVGVGFHGWCGGVPGLLRVFNQAGGLTCQPDSQFQIPVLLPFLQGTGASSSADHSWVGPLNRDWYLTVYPPPYLRKGFGPFFCHESTQLWGYDQGFSP